MSDYTLDLFPGPTDEARQIQRRQTWARDCCYDIMNHRDIYESTEAYDAALATANQAYDETVQQLLALLGPDAACNLVDEDLFSAFSDCHKDAVGFRPRFHISREGVQRWFKRYQEEEARQEDVCPACNNTGMTDSGGTQPWGEAILIPCHCSTPAVTDLPSAPPSSLLAEKLKAALANTV